MRNNKDAAPRIHWKRVVAAAFLSELAVIVMLLAIMAIYRLAIAPGLTSAQYERFADLAGYYLAAPLAALSTFVFSLWAVRSIQSRIVVNGILVGTIATIPASGFLFAAKPEDRLMYILSFVLRILAGYCAGLAALKMKGVDSSDYARQVR
jgi:hypothetical protein